MIYKSKLGDLVFNLDTLIEFQDLTGKDALEMISQDRGATDNIRFIKNLVTAASKDNPEAVKKFGDLNTTDLAEILNAFAKSLSAPQEVSDDTQREGQTTTA